MQKWRLILAIALTGIATGAAARRPRARRACRAVSSICAISIPTIIQDIRYAGSNNFVGRPLAGYRAAECVVKREVAMALRSDPGRAGAAKAVAENVRLLPAGDARSPTWWRGRGTARKPPPQRRYNPAFANRICSGSAISPTHSGHSTGAALDLTLVDLTADNSATFDPGKAYGDCTAPAEARAPEGSIDMGTGYDCSDVKAHTATNSITTAQRRWRNTLVAAMAKQGFANYSKEWWHFSLPGAGAAGL